MPLHVFSGPTINVDGYKEMEDSHGFIFQNKIIKGKDVFGTIIKVQDTTNKESSNSLLAVINPYSHEVVNIYRAASIGVILDAFRFIGKIGGSPLSKKEVNKMKIDISAPDEFLTITGYSGFGACGFISQDSLLCFAYVPIDVPPLSEQNTILTMKSIPSLSILKMGKVEQVKTRLAVAIWTKQ